jgi:hypothetical protein
LLNDLKELNFSNAIPRRLTRNDAWFPIFPSCFASAKRQRSPNNG